MLLAGCYERFLFGYQVEEGDQAKAGGSQQQLRRTFTHAAHKGVVKCAAAAGPYAATGGADDLIHLYDLKNDKDLGFLMSPGEGAVTALAFYTPAGAYAPTHLLSGSADGSISVWQAGGGWEQMKTMRGHKKEVQGISVHPSGLVALSVSRDCCLRMWDLVKGRCTYTVRLEVEAESVAFCPEDGGARYALLCGALLTLHSVGGEAGALRTLAHPRRVLCMAWAPGNRVVTGVEDGSLRLWDVKTGAELLCINRAHASRIRALALLPTGSDRGGSKQQQPLLVATGSSDGSLKLWDLSKAEAAAAAAPAAPGGSGGACLAEAQTRARLTCMAAADRPDVMQQRQAAAAKARQQQQQQQGGNKRKAGDAAAAGGGGKQQPAAADAEQEQQRPAKKRKAGKQAEPAAKQQQQQQPQARGGKPTQKRKDKQGGAAAPAAPTAAAGNGVVVRDGVVEFLDSPAQQKRREKKQKEVQQKRRAAAQHGKPFRSVPGQQRPAGHKAKPLPQGQGGGQKGKRPGKPRR